MPRKALVVVLSDASLINLSEREYWDMNSAFQTKVQPRHFMRVGAYSVCIGLYDLAISAPDDYRAPIVVGHPAYVGPDSEFYEESKADRLSQLARIERALFTFGHPFAGLVQLEIEAERSSYLRGE